MAASPTTISEFILRVLEDSLLSATRLDSGSIFNRGRPVHAEWCYLKLRDTCALAACSQSSERKIPQWSSTQYPFEQMKIVSRNACFDPYSQFGLNWNVLPFMSIKHSAIVYTEIFFPERTSYRRTRSFCVRVGKSRIYLFLIKRR